MRRIFWWRYLFLFIVLLALLAFPFGPLFPWSPIHPGYKEQSFRRATVLYPANIELPEAYRHVDEYIDRAEKFHRLPMKSRVTVILCRNWSDAIRFMPMPKTKMVGGLTYAYGTVIFITPKVEERGFDPGEFIKHEMSHATLHQNHSPWNTRQIARQEWFAEGLAVSFGEQKAFVTPEEFVTYAQTNALLPIIDPEQRSAAPKPFNMRLGYQVWRYFLEHLVETRGRDKFQQFMTAYIASPKQYRELFVQTYGISLPQAIAQFQSDLRENSWKPNPEFVEQQLSNESKM